MMNSVWMRRGLFAGGVTSMVYLGDTFLYDRTFQRSLRTLGYGLLVTLDYKLNFTAEHAEQIHDLQLRVAQRILHVCTKNAGLYIKFGQQIGSLNHVLPPEWNQTLRPLYDDAPKVSFEQVEQIFLKEFGVPPSQLYEEFDPEPIASASIAQVHKAKLKDGTNVAVKVQKPEIATQMEWDLLCYRFVVWSFSKIFDMPLMWTVDYIENHLRTEVDFMNEGRNAERAHTNLKQVKHLRDSCYIPKIYWDHSSKRILTCEWIDGVKFGDVKTMQEHGFNVASVMKTCVEVFADQIFRTGFIHGDPHRGNLLVRQHPLYPSTHQLVLLDHGLYCAYDEPFRQEYARFWKALFTVDTATLEQITKRWGIADSTAFVSGTLQRPWKPEHQLHLSQRSYNMQDIYEMQLYAKKRARDFLSNTEHFPRPLMLIGRNLNLIRANNKMLGSPVNRINIMADIAVHTLSHEDKDLWKGSLPWISWLPAFMRPVLGYWTFRTSLWVSFLFFRMNQWWQTVNRVVLGKDTQGYEERLDAIMRENIKRKFGIVIDESTFDA